MRIHVLVVEKVSIPGKNYLRFRVFKIYLTKVFLW